MARRVLGLAAAMLLVVAACSGETPTPRAGGPGSAPTALEAAEAAVDSLGDDLTAALAILLALDRGYTPGQIVEAVMAGGLLANGVVARGVEPAQPDGIPTDVIVDKGPLELAAAQGTMILALGPTGAAVTVDEAKGYLDAFDGWVTEQIAPAQPEPPHVDPDELERLIRYIVTFKMLRFADDGWSAEQIIEALIFQDFVCVPYEGCSIPEGTPANSALGGVLASAEPGPEASEDSVEAPTEPVGDGDPYQPDDGVYEGVPTPNLVEAFQQTMDEGEVTVVISDGEYTLSMRVVVTSQHGRCTGVRTTEYTAPGIRFERGTYISFHGELTHHRVFTCPDSDPETDVETNPDFGATVWIDESRRLTAHLPAGMGRDVPLSFVASE